MPTYMVQASYTSTAWNKLVQRPTVLMSPDEGFDALLLAQGAGYRPPGG